jgi:hypothetical protein
VHRAVSIEYDERETANINNGSQNVCEALKLFGDLFTREKILERKRKIVDRVLNLSGFLPEHEKFWGGHKRDVEKQLQEENPRV